MADINRLGLFDFKDGEELMFAELEKGVAFAAVHLFEIEDVFVECHRLFNVIDFNRDVIAAVNFNALLAQPAHFVIYTDCARGENVSSAWMSSVISRFYCLSFLAWP